MSSQHIVVGTYNYGKHPGMPAFDYHPGYTPSETWDSEGIYIIKFDSKTGVLSDCQLAAKALNPSYVCLHPSGNYLYAINELEEFEGKPSGAVTAYKVNRNGNNAPILTVLNTVSSFGTTTCHITTDKEGNNVFVSNYNGATVSCYSVLQDGTLANTQVNAFSGNGPNIARQSHAHPHSTKIDAQGRFLFVTDLGADVIASYKLEKGILQHYNNIKTAAGSGPRQLSWHPNGKYAYVINELVSTINVYSYDGNGILTELQLLDISPSHYKGTRWSSEIQVHPDGKYLYATNRILDQFVICQINSEGKLEVIGTHPTGGRTPRNFEIDPSGNHILVANQHEDNITTFKIDKATGALEQTSVIRVPSAACVKFM